MMLFKCRFHFDFTSFKMQYFKIQLKKSISVIDYCIRQQHMEVGMITILPSLLDLTTLTSLP